MDMDDKLVNNITVEDWLNFFRNAEFVVTDSCHGISFSIVFHKNFVGIANKDRGAARFESLVDVFDVRDHYVRDAADIPVNEELLAPVDYDKVDGILEPEKERAIAWLKEVLFKPREYDSFSAYSAIDRRMAKEKED